MTMFNNDPFFPVVQEGARDFLELNPQIAYQGWNQNFGKAPNSQKFFQDQFTPIHNQFLGNLTRQITSGQAPTARFTDFMDNFNFKQYAASKPPWMRGAQTGQFAPPTRFLPNF